MNNRSLKLAAAGFVLCALASPTFAAQATNGVVITPTVDNVTIYTVSPIESPPTPAVKEIPVASPVAITIVLYPSSLRWWHYNRALGQRYPGFIRMYSGNPYPF